MAHLEQLKMLGQFGFYEALDYTKSRLPAGETHAIVQSYMAHHQGMILLASCNYLLDDVMVQRFHADERIQSIELLLQEKIPQNPPIEYPHPDEPADLPGRAFNHQLTVARTSRQSYSAGACTFTSRNQRSDNQCRGRLQPVAEFVLTRWQADTTLDHWGTWIYVQDLESGALWSATCQPIGCSPVGTRKCMFYPHKVEFQRSDNGISLRTGVTVSPDGVEIRRVNILNDGEHPRRLKLTSYGEVVLAAQAIDRRHPAFNKLFIESEYLPKENALIFQRRPRSADEKPIVLIHAMIIEAGRKVTGEHESDRAQFLGRSRTTRTPLVLQNAIQPLPGTTGGTLDPILSLAQEIDLKAACKNQGHFPDIGCSFPRRSIGKALPLPIRTSHPPRL